MKIKEMVEETVKSGITPIRIQYDVVNFFSDAVGADAHELSTRMLLRSFMVIESLDLGTLTYRQYRFVARRTKQGDHMIRRHIQKLFRAFTGITALAPNAECITVPVYARLLKDGLLASLLFDAFSLYPEVPPSKICIELSADILYEDMEESKKRIEELRSLGVKIAICEVGDEFCPVFRLSEIGFDYAFIDTYATASLDREDAERVAGSLVKFLHFLDVSVLAPDLDSEEKMRGAKYVGCDGFGFADTVLETYDLPGEAETEAPPEGEAEPETAEGETAEDTIPAEEMTSKQAVEETAEQTTAEETVEETAEETTAEQTESASAEDDSAIDGLSSIDETLAAVDALVELIDARIEELRAEDEEVSDGE